jgi:hypothetical protein
MFAKRKYTECVQAFSTRRQEASTAVAFQVLRALRRMTGYGTCGAGSATPAAPSFYLPAVTANVKVMLLRCAALARCVLGSVVPT